MNIQFYFEKLNKSQDFQNFKKENPKAFLCSAFFSIDKVAKDNKQHFDYFIDNKIFSFQLEDNCKKIELENYSQEIPKEISEKIELEFEDFEELIIKKMEKEKIKNKIQKFLFSLQKINKENFLVGTVFISGMGMIQIKIDIDKKEIIEFQKKSIFDILKVVKKK